MTELQSNPQLELAENYLCNTGVSIFLTGKAGTGKTTFLRSVLSHIQKRYVVVAPTGVAAVNAGGVTIHSFFQLPLCPYLPDVPELVTEYQLPEAKRQLRKSRVDIIRTLELLVIDEISMVRADLLDAVDFRLRHYRRNNRPFGGVQLLMIGDIHQLPPVVTDNERPYLERIYASPFFFESKAFKKLNCVSIELRTVYRQQDKDFIKILNCVRDNRLSPEVITALNTRYVRDVDGCFNGNTKLPIRLTTHNAQADKVNQQQLERLKTKEWKLDAQIEGTFPESMYPTESTMCLKAGAQVMFVKNDTSGLKQYYNGKIGIVKSYSRHDDCVTVESDGEVIEVSRTVWENTRYEINPDDKSIIQIVDGTYSQFPLRLAWAITIHKAQGLTFDNVIVDAADAFAYGQVYVALSRCRSLQGLVLSSPISQSCTFHNKSISDFTANQPSEDEVRRNYDTNALTYFVDVLFDLLSVSQLYDIATRIDQFCRAHLMKTYPKSVQSWSVWISKLVELTSIVDRFRIQVNRIVASEGSVPAAFSALSPRISKAIVYFTAQYSEIESGMLPLLNMELDNKERSKTFNDLVDRFHFDIGLKTACLRYVDAHGFSVEKYQKAKVDYLLDSKIQKTSKKDNSRSTSKQAIVYDVRHPELVPRLIRWRRDKTDELGVPAFVVLSQKSLLAIADRLPRTSGELARVPGIGKRKLSQFGDELLSIVEDFCADNGL